MTESKGKILIVDDEEPVRKVCERTLTNLGFIVEAVSTGEAALLLLNKNFDFVLTDIYMPGSMDGTQLVEEIKAKAPWTDVVVMTSAPTLETAISTLKHGAYDYLLKPFGPELLQSVVMRCFEKRRLSEELNREKAMRQELQAAYSELQKVERLKDAFLSRLNHELRTPVAVVLVASDVIATEQQSGQKSEKSIDMLRSRLFRLKEILEDLLLFSKLSTGSYEVHRAKTDPRRLLEELVQNYKSLWHEKRLTVQVAMQDGIESLWIDSGLMKTVFKHLLLNAIQFNKKGGSIHIQGKEESGQVHISFADTGIGIPQDKQTAVFDSFYQVAEYLTREIGGLGLGLAIARRIVEAHGGRVTVNSQKGEGSLFTVILPKPAVAAPQIPG